MLQMGASQPSITAASDAHRTDSLRYRALDPASLVVQGSERFRCLSLPCRLERLVFLLGVNSQYPTHLLGFRAERAGIIVANARMKCCWVARTLLPRFQ